MPDSYPSYPSPPTHTAHYPLRLSRPPLDESCPTENSFPSTPYEPHPPTDNTQSFTSNTYAFLSPSKTRPQPSYPPIMLMQGYNYGCHDLFQHLQSISELVHHLPSDDLPFPHSTSTTNVATSYSPSKYTNTSKKINPPIALSTEPPRQRTSTSKTANSPIPPSTARVKPSPPPAASAKTPSDRSRKYRARLLAVNGIRTPSKSSVQKVTDAQIKDNCCPICGRGHNRPHHLESHFIGCAERNGNPEGYFWNELLVYYKGRVRNKRERDVASDGEENGGGKRARGTGRR